MQITDKDQLPEIMRNMRIPCLVLADAHIKPRTWTNWSQLRYDAYEALKGIHVITDNWPQHHRCRCILAGDTFDSSTVLSSDLIRLTEALTDYEVHYIRGNHDSVIPSYLEALPNTSELTDDTPLVLTDSTGIHSYKIFGLSYMSDRNALLERLDAIAASLTRTELAEGITLVLHQAMAHLIGYESAAQLSIDDITARLGTTPRVLVGHIHKVDYRPLSEGPGYILSPGSLYPTSWSDVAEPFCLTLIDLAGYSVFRLPNTVRSYHMLDTAVVGDRMRDTISSIISCNTNPLRPAIRITADDITDPRIPSVGSSDALITVTCRSGSSGEVGNSTAELLADDMSLMDAVRADLSVLPEELSDAATKVAEYLLRSPDASSALISMLEKWGCGIKPHRSSNV